MIRGAKPRAGAGAALVLAAAIAGAATPAPKRPLSHRDYDPWRSISAEVLSRDGRWLAYAYMPQSGDGDLIVRNLASGKEWRENVGALPPPVIQTAEETNPEEPLPRPEIRIAITSDGRYAVSTSYPPKAEADRNGSANGKDKDREKVKGLLLLDLATGGVTRIPLVKSVQVPSRGGAWVAYLREPAREDKKDDGKEGKDEGGSRAGRGKDKKAYGSDLVLRDLARGTERVFPAVADCTFARDGRTLLYTVSSRQEEPNGVYAVTPGSDAAPVALLAGKGRYLKLGWDRDQSRAAFVSDRDDPDGKPARFKAYLWERGAPAARAVVGTGTPGLPADLAVSDKGQLAFSRDGRKLYVPVAPPRPEREEKENDRDERVVADLWHWKDDLVQSMQRVRANQERTRTYRGVFHIAENRYVQLADASLRTVILTDDGDHAIGLDDRPYRRRVDYDGSYNDVYLVDGSSGSRRLVLQEFRGGGGQGAAGGGAAGGGGTGGGGGGGALQWSPDGTHAFYFADKHWHLLDGATGATRNVTAALGVNVHDEDDDRPGPPGSYGSSTWTRDSRSFLIYDRYDVWQVFADGRPALNLTGGEGRRSQIQLRVQRIEPREDDDDERGLDPSKPLYLRGVSEQTRASGFFKDGFAPDARLERLLWADRSQRFVARAPEADVLLISASRFDEYPDLYTTDSSFRRLTKVTDGGAQLAPYLWGKGELVDYKNADGKLLQAALYTPEGFDPKKKYPLLVYIYERLSQNVHNFVEPRPGTSINIAYYVSNGYLVLTPDIVYEIGSPGRSALKCVLPAIQSVVNRGFVDEQAIGIQGHSWGGYQIAYLVTQTNRFRAAAAGAPVGNMTSAYSGIRWGSGQPRQFQYEKSQSRIARTLFEAPFTYLENSPVFHVEAVSTPLMILHNDQDDAVPWTQGIELYLALRRSGKEVYLWNYNGEFHGLRRRHNQKDYTVRLQQFFDHHLKGAPRPEWMETGIPFLEREEEKDRLQQAIAPEPEG